MKYRYNPFRVITLAFFFSLLIIASCSKENSQSLSSSDQEEQASLISSQADGEAELVFTDIFDDVIGASDDVGIAGAGVFGRFSGGVATDGLNGVQHVETCFTTTITHPGTGFFPVRIVLDFGTAGCTGTDGHTRRGKIITDYTNRLVYPGATATTTFDGFYIDSIQVQGTHTINNTGSTSSRQLTVDVTDAKLTKPSGNYTQWTSHKVITQTEGLATADFHDDVFSVQGSAHGQTKKENLLAAWDSNIAEPLVKKFVCHWIVQGKIRTLRVNTSATSPWAAVLDFGNGDCDNQAVITINGVAHNITLH
jgi:hypothetical protein